MAHEGRWPKSDAQFAAALELDQNYSYPIPIVLEQMERYSPGANINRPAANERHTAVVRREGQTQAWDAVIVSAPPAY